MFSELMKHLECVCVVDREHCVEEVVRFDDGKIRVTPGVDLSGCRRAFVQDSVSIQNMSGGRWGRQVCRLGALQGCIQI